MHVTTRTLGIALLGGLVYSGAAAGATAAPAGGAVRLFITPNLANNGATGTVVITGAVGDFGTFLTIDKNGKADPNGHFIKITLKQGTFEIDSVTLDAAANNRLPAITQATCSAYLSLSGPVTLLDGTGLYKGIAGTVKITETFAIIYPRYTSGAKKGQCDESGNAQPSALYGSITGSGTVRFS